MEAGLKRAKVEAAFKKVYDLYLYGFVDTDEWVLIMVLFFNWALQQEELEAEGLIEGWMHDVNKKHPNPKGRYIKDESTLGNN